MHYSLGAYAVKSKVDHPIRLSIVEIARKAGVSSATVSRAFNRPELLKTSTLAHVEKIAGEHGFRPNRVGRSLRQGSTRTLGLLLPTLKNPVFADCFEGACRHAQHAGYSVMVATSNYSPRDEMSGLKALIDHQVDGLILTLGATITGPLQRLLQDSGVPYILAYSAIEGVPSVGIDDHRAGQDLIDLLVGLGHRRIAFASGPLRSSDRAVRRLLGARQAVQRHGLPELGHLLMREHTHADARVVKQALQAGSPPSALIGSNDMLALSLIARCRQLGLRVPRDVSVCGVDGITFGAMSDPPLTTVVQPGEEIGRSACQSLLMHLREQRGMHSTRVAHHISPGGTVRPLSPPDSRGFP
ncbi:LacI family transcriptional regulator [Bordetella trematum]|nr:LacI family transcriptional regulator [Bordetella trematum]